MPVSPQTAVEPPHFEGPAHRHVHTEPGGHLQCVWCDLLSEKTGGGTVGWVDGWMDG